MNVEYLERKTKMKTAKTIQSSLVDLGNFYYSQYATARDDIKNYCNYYAKLSVPMGPLALAATEIRFSEMEKAYEMYKSLVSVEIDFICTKTPYENKRNNKIERPYLCQKQ
jgi:hypothetical protein